MARVNRLRQAIRDLKLHAANDEWDDQTARNKMPSVSEVHVHMPKPSVRPPQPIRDTAARVASSRVGKGAIVSAALVALGAIAELTGAIRALLELAH